MAQKRDPSSPQNDESTIDVGDVDRRHRIYIPGKLTQNLSWWDKTSEVLALLRFDEPGRISLLSWNEHSPLVRAGRDSLLKSLPDHEAEDALTILNARYHELSGERSGRPTLPIVAMLHLFGSREFDSHVFVVRFLSRLELWSIAYRNQKLLKGSPLLDDLDLP